MEKQRIERVFITPQYAKLILENNTHNRPVRERHVKFLKDEMANGRFVETGDTIKIADDGTLLDGQHRLLACVESGVGFHAIIVFGVGKEAFTVIDTGKKRSASDTLYIAGISRPDKLASIAGVLSNRFNTLSTRNRSNDQILEFARKNECLLHSMFNICNRLYNNNVKLISASRAAAYMYAMSHTSPSLATEFIESFFTGEQLSSSNTPIIVRNQIIDTRLKNKRYSPKMEYRLMSKAFRLYVRGESRRFLRVKDNESIPDIDYGSTPTQAMKDFFGCHNDGGEA